MKNMTETRSPIADWEDRMMSRYALTASAVAQLRGGRRKDIAGVLRELRRTWDELAYICAIFPQTAESFFLKTAMDLVADRIEQLDAQLEKEAEQARRNVDDDADDDDNPEDYAPRT